MYNVKEMLFKLMEEEKTKEYAVEKFEEILWTVKEEHPKCYEHLLDDLYELAYDNHFTEELALSTVAKMENSDNSIGEYWTLEQTTDVAKHHDYDVNYCDFYVVMNMLHSDYAHILGNDTDTFAKMSKAYICDKDSEKMSKYKIWRVKG